MKNLYEITTRRKDGTFNSVYNKYYVIAKNPNEAFDKIIKLETKEYKEIEEDMPDFEIKELVLLSNSDRGLIL